MAAGAGNLDSHVSATQDHLAVATANEARCYRASTKNHDEGQN